MFTPARSGRPPTGPATGLYLATALDRNEALTGLLQRVQASRARLEAVTDLLPQALRGEIRAGPLDDTRWVLLVPNAAAAAKLRQLLPALDAALAAAGFNGPATRIKVLPKA